MKAYYINVDSASERNNRFMSRIKNVNTTFTRISGVTPNQLQTYNVVSNSCNSNTDLEICCSLSHLKAIHQAFHDTSNPNDIALIMEDDMLFKVQNINWNEIVASAPNDWEILQLFTLNASIYDINDKYNLWIKHQQHDTCSTGAYIIKRAAMEKLLSVFVPQYLSPWNNINYITFLNVSCVADTFLYSFLNTYVYRKILFNEEGIDSLIHSDHLPMHRSHIDAINNIFKENNELKFSK